MSASDFSSFETLLVDRKDTALFVTLNRPESRNALSSMMWTELDAVFAAIRDDRSVRAVVMRGAGKNFSAGGDLKERDSIRDATESMDALKARNSIGGEILLRIDRSPQAVIAVVEGNALGGGVGLACVSDIVIAHESAVFRLPELGLGIPPAQIAPYVVRRVGLVKARLLALTTASIRGSDSVDLGLADIFCPTTAEIDVRIEELLAGIGRCGPEAIGRAKTLLETASRSCNEEYIAYAADAFATAYMSPEGREGAAAARERRRPTWQDPQK